MPDIIAGFGKMFTKLEEKKSDAEDTGLCYVLELRYSNACILQFLVFSRPSSKK